MSHDYSVTVWLLGLPVIERRVPRAMNVSDGTELSMWLVLSA